jgi:hypothetical protein
MQRILILALLASSSVFAQTEQKNVFFSEASPVVAAGGAFQQITSAPVQGAPYSATITNESIQTLADGNRIVQTNTGTTVRDSQGRTRQDAPLPPIGNMSPADAPHLVFIQDPVAQTSYTLNLTDKTAMKGPSLMPLSAALSSAGAVAGGGVSVRIRGASGLVVNGPQPLPQTFGISKNFVSEESGKPQTEDLGSQTMEGVLVNGTRTTRTIPAGQIGNDKSLSIVTEVWTSPDLKTVVYSKRSDPRMGDQTFKLTNIMRVEPDPSLFTIPADFKINDEPQPIMYKTTGGPAQ